MIRAAGRLPLDAALERGSSVIIVIDGRPVQAYLGETVAAVLFAEGRAAIRTTTSGEPRGVFCGMGVCFDCVVVVNGIPNTRACMTWVAAGMDVRTQEGWGPGDPGS